MNIAVGSHCVSPGKKGVLLFGLLLCLLQTIAAIAPPNTPSVDELKSRRRAYTERVKDGVTVIFNAPKDETHKDEVEKNFYYVTGFSGPDAILVLSPRHPQYKETLFVPERDPSQEKWTGPELEAGPESARILGIDRVLTLSRFQSELKALANDERRIYTPLSGHFETRPTLLEADQVSRLKQMFPFSEIRSARADFAYLRMNKSPSELSRLQKAIQITLEGQRAAASLLTDGRYEYEAEAALEYEFRRRGAARPGFPSIVASGPNSVILHYDKNIRRMQEGDLVVVDIGAEFEEYTADITRTYPVSGKFTPRQREIYEIVLGAQEAALKEVRPGVMVNKNGPIHKAALEYIRSHGKDSKGDSLDKYFIHGTSHHLGLEVHDAVSDTSRLLEPGMVITVEPGIYIPEENIGIRLEDDVLVTETGCELLSKNLPRRVEEIEKMIRERQRNKVQESNETNTKGR